MTSQGTEVESDAGEEAKTYFELTILRPAF